MLKSVICLIINLIGVFAYSQVAKFPSKPTKRVIGDSVIFELTDVKGYDYFTNHFHFDLVYTIDSTNYYMVEIVDSISGRGSFCIYNNNNLIYYYDITNNMIQGIGVYYFDNRVLYFSEFKNGYKDGVGTTFSSSGEIERIFLFKKNKFKKYLYHKLSNSKKQLKRVNKNAKGPFSPIAW